MQSQNLTETLRKYKAKILRNDAKAYLLSNSNMILNLVKPVNFKTLSHTNTMCSIDINEHCSTCLQLFSLLIQGSL